MKIENDVIILDNPIEDTENGYIIDRIDIRKLVSKRLMADSKIDGVSLTNNLSVISFREQDMIIKYGMQYDNEKIIVTGTIFKDGEEHIKVDKEIDLEVLTTQITESIKERNGKGLNVSSLPIITEKLEEIKDEFYKTSFNNNIMLLREEYNYKINIYISGTDTLIGTANRLLIEGNSLLLMEAIMFDQYSLNNVDLKMIIDHENVVVFEDLLLDSSSGKSIKYCSFNIIDCRVAKRREYNNPDKLKFKGIKLPYKNASTKALLDELLRLNSQNSLIRCYKQNKSMNIEKLNINKYLLS